jgi:hypothetical protein
MKTRNPAWKAVAALLAAGAASVGAAEEAAPQPPPAAPAALSERLQKSTPEEREVQVRQHGDQVKARAAQRREDRDQRRQTAPRLAPEEREAKIKELRERTNRPPVRSLSPEEREAKRSEIKARLDKRIAEMRQQQAQGTLSPEDARKLARMEEIARRFEAARPPARPRPAPVPPAPDTKP